MLAALFFAHEGTKYAKNTKDFFNFTPLRVLCALCAFVRKKKPLKKCAVMRVLSVPLCEKKELLANVKSVNAYQKFMASDVAKSMDNEISPFHNTGIVQIENALQLQTKFAPCITPIQNDDLSYWIGYLYRYWNKWLNHSSASIYQKADFHRMSTVYTQFHTLAPEQAILRLLKG